MSARHRMKRLTAAASTDVPKVAAGVATLLLFVAGVVWLEPWQVSIKAVVTVIDLALAVAVVVAAVRETRGRPS